MAPTPSTGSGQALAKTTQGWGTPSWNGAGKNKNEKVGHPTGIQILGTED